MNLGPWAKGKSSQELFHPHTLVVNCLLTVLRWFWMICLRYASSIRNALAQVAFDLTDRSTLVRKKVSINNKLKIIGPWKYELLLPVKLHISELNAWNRYGTEFNISLHM